MSVLLETIFGRLLEDKPWYSASYLLDDIVAKKPARHIAAVAGARENSLAPVNERDIHRLD